MKIRSATLFQGDDIDNFKRSIEKLNLIREEQEIYTVRAAVKDREDTVLQNFCRQNTWGYSFSYDIEEIDEELSTLIGNHLDDEKCFVNINLSDHEVDTNKVLSVAELIKRTGSKKKSGFAGFRLGVGINTPENIPFFPYAKSKQDKSSLSVALEMCFFLEDLIRKNQRLSLSILREKIEEAIETELLEKQSYFFNFCKQNDIIFNGFDLSIAPFPYPIGETSAASLIQKLGSMGRNRSQKKFEFGNPGTLFLHTYLTSILKSVAKKGTIKTCGFNGMMYSLLEDNDLSRLFEEDKIRISDISILSSTCGCGVDMIPLSCETQREEIAGHILDIFSLSSILRKPLGVRLLVSPDTRPGDMTEYQHIFLSNTRVKKSAPGLQIVNLPKQTKDGKVGFYSDHE